METHEPLFDPDAERVMCAGVADIASLSIQSARVVAQKSCVQRSDFYRDELGKVWAAQLELLQEGFSAGPMEVSTKLPTVDRGWLMNELTTDGGVFEHNVVLAAKRLKDLAVRRRLVLLAGSMVGECYELGGDISKTLSKFSSQLATITRAGASVRTLKEVMPSVHSEINKLQEGKTLVMKTGLEIFDRVIGGLWPTLTVVAAHAGIGKSAFLATIIRQLAMRGIKVGVFSLEDQAQWLVWRYLSSASKVPQFVMRTRALNESQYDSVGSSWAGVETFAENIHIDDRSGLTPGEIVQTARDMILNRDCKVIVLDHLGKMTTKGGRTERYDLDLKESLDELIGGICKPYDVPLLCATHLRREASSPPGLRDFANGQAIENASRVAVAFERKGETQPLVAHVLKNTHGKAPLSFDLDFDGASSMVEELPTKPEQVVLF